MRLRRPNPWCPPEASEALGYQAFLREQPHEADRERQLAAVVLVQFLLVDVAQELLRVRDLARRDLDALMTFMTDDCVFASASGPDVCGTRHEGHTRVHAAFARIFGTFPDVQFVDARHVVAGDRGVPERLFRGTRAGGRKVEVNGCDLFTFRNGKIAVKSSHLKSRSA